MKYSEAAGRANLARAERTTQDILTGVNYSVGLPVGGGEDDYYVLVIRPNADNTEG